VKIRPEEDRPNMPTAGTNSIQDPLNFSQASAADLVPAEEEKPSADLSEPVGVNSLELDESQVLEDTEFQRSAEEIGYGSFATVEDTEDQLPTLAEERETRLEDSYVAEVDVSDQFESPVLITSECANYTKENSADPLESAVLISESRIYGKRFVCTMCGISVMSKHNLRRHVSIPTSVTEPELEPEPVEQQLFAGAGAKVFLARLRSRVYKFL
jgi:hypothetical protein